MCELAVFSDRPKDSEVVQSTPSTHPNVDRWQKTATVAGAACQLMVTFTYFSPAA